MKRIIHFIFLLTFILVSSHHSNAQTDRANFDIKNQKIEVTPTFETQPAENIPEKQIIVKFQPNDKKADSLLPANQTMSNMLSTKAGTKQNYSVQRSQRKNEINDDESSKIKKMEDPLFPDLKVEAIQEQPYDNGFVSKEKPTKTLVKLERVPFDNVPVTDAITTSQDYVTISPSKRKYLEGMVIELEKDIQLNSGTTGIDMQAKKKELEDLKKLLAR